MFIFLFSKLLPYSDKFLLEKPLCLVEQLDDPCLPLISHKSVSVGYCLRFNPTFQYLLNFTKLHNLTTLCSLKLFVVVGLIGEREIFETASPQILAVVVFFTKSVMN